MINTPLFNTEIQQFLDGLNLPYFKGVFSSNDIPYFSGNYSIICNLSNVLEEGTHFVCICKIKDSLFFFDSLALNVFNNDLNMYLARESYQCSTFYFVKQPVQSWISQGCGYYCIFFVLLFHISLSHSLVGNKLVSFSKQVDLNDSICLININRLIKSMTQ